MSDTARRQEIAEPSRENEKSPSEAAVTIGDLKNQLDRMSAENLVLKQRSEFAELFAQNERIQATQFKEYKDSINTEINKRLVGVSLVGLVLLGIAWYQTITPIRKDVQTRLDKEFASDNIRNLISDAAQKAAQEHTGKLMEDIIKPATDKALADIQEHRDEVSQIATQLKRDTSNMVGEMRSEVSQQSTQEKTALQTLHDEYTKDLTNLKALVIYQEKVKDIQLMTDEAISGESDSFDKLANYPSTDKGLRDAADAGVIQTKLAYVFGDRVRGISIWMNNPDGSHGLTNEAIPAFALINTFLRDHNQTWAFRVKAAQLLSARREAEVPPALLESMRDDPNLWVRRASLVSFQQLTGFQSNDAFGFTEAVEWWDKNKATYLSSIPKK